MLWHLDQLAETEGLHRRYQVTTRASRELSIITLVTPSAIGHPGVKRQGNVSPAPVHIFLHDQNINFTTTIEVTR